MYKNYKTTINRYAKPFFSGCGHKVPVPFHRLSSQCPNAFHALSDVWYKTLTQLMLCRVTKVTEPCTMWSLIIIIVFGFPPLYLLTGRCYEAEICVILFLLRCPFIWYPFWPKSKFSDFGQKPWTIIRRFYQNRGDFLRSFLLHSGRCYEAEICAILFLLRCPFIWYPFWPKSKFSYFGQKPWTIIRRFYRNRGDFLRSFLLHSGRCYEAEICAILFLLRCPFIWYPFWPKSKFSYFGQKPWTIIRRFYRNRGDFLRSFLLHSGRCYEAEICAILFLLRCPFIWYPF